MDFQQIMQLLSNEGVLVFLVVYNVLYSEKNRKEQTQVLTELKTIIERLTIDFNEKGGK